MRKRRLLVLLLALGSILALSVGGFLYWKHRGKVASMLTSESVTLPNGLEAQLIAGDCGNNAAVIALFAVGANHDPAGRSGMTHVIERVLAAKAGAGASKRSVESGSDHTAYASVVPADQIFGELDAIAGLIKNLGLTKADVESARKQVLDDVTKRRGGDAALTAVTLAAESIQPSRGNGRRGGIADEVEAIDLGAVDKFWRAHFTPDNTRIVVLGRIDRDKLRAHIQKTFAALPAGTKPVLRPAGESTVIGTLVMGDAPKSVAIAVPAPAPSERVFPAFLVAASRLIGDGAGRHTWTVSYDPIATPETLFVTGAVQAGEAAEPAAKRIRDETTKLLAAPLTPADVASARERFGSFLGFGDAKTCASDPLALASSRARRAQLGLDKFELAHALDATTQDQLTQAAALFDPRRTTTVIAGGAIR